MLPTSDTRVSYPDGATVSSGTVVHTEALADGRTAVVLDHTALHPVDAAWPDQPADRGTLRWAGGEAVVVDALTGGVRDGELLLGAALPVRMGTEGWTFVVAHLVDGDHPAVGEEVQVTVDDGYRRALSAGHTACHLASLALDAALADAWTKPVPPDALGNPGFDAAANQSSRIHEYGSIDVYRLGKSLRKKGFTVAALDELDAVTSRANATLADWVATGAGIHIERADDALSARRSWVCALPQGEAHIPCGGTHLTGLDEVDTIRVALDAGPVDGGLELRMRTTVALRP